MQISFILVEPATPENVGAAARALKTMGFFRLLLVNPCNHLSNEARWLAHASNEILEKAEIFGDLERAIKGFDFIIGTTAKKRSVKNDYLSLSELSLTIEEKGNTINKIAIVFGREESGLKNEELKLCDLVTTVPLKTPYPSLNLAQAVMLYAYELSKLNHKTLRSKAKNIESFTALKEKVNMVLKETGFKTDTNIYPRFLERINMLDQDDINLLHSFCNKVLENKK